MTPTNQYCKFIGHNATTSVEVVKEVWTAAPVECMVGILHKSIDFTQTLTCEASHEGLSTVLELSSLANPTVTTTGQRLTIQFISSWTDYHCPVMLQTSVQSIFRL